MGSKVPGPKMYDPLVLHDARKVGLGHGKGAPAFSVRSRIKPLKPKSGPAVGPGPAAYPAGVDSTQGVPSINNSTTLGRFSPRQGSMTGLAVPPRRKVGDTRPDPGQYTPGCDRLGRGFASGADMPS